MAQRINSQCIETQYARDSDGYGCRKYNGKMQKAHRVAWKQVHGEITSDQHVLHKCDNPACVNIDHLFLGDNAINQADSKAKGRTAMGQRNGQSSLTEAQVLEIRSKYKLGRGPGGPRVSGVATQQSLANEYGVNQTLIGFIVRRESWKHI